VDAESFVVRDAGAVLLDDFKIFVEDDCSQQKVFFDFEFVGDDGGSSRVVIRDWTHVFCRSFFGGDVGGRDGPATSTVPCRVLLFLGGPSAVSILRDQRVSQQGLPFRVAAERGHAAQDGVLKCVVVFVRKRIRIVIALPEGHLRIFEDLRETSAIAEIELLQSRFDFR